MVTQDCSVIGRKSKGLSSSNAAVKRDRSGSEQAETETTKECLLKWKWSFEHDHIKKIETYTFSCPHSSIAEWWIKVFKLSAVVLF